MEKLVHSGFSEREERALAGFCEYYGVTINYETVCVPEFMNPLFLKMICEIAQEKEDKSVVVSDIGNLMEEFFMLKNKKIWIHSFSTGNVLSPCAAGTGRKDRKHWDCRP